MSNRNTSKLRQRKQVGQSHLTEDAKVVSMEGISLNETLTEEENPVEGLLPEEAAKPIEKPAKLAKKIYTGLSKVSRLESKMTKKASLLTALQNKLVAVERSGKKAGKLAKISEKLSKQKEKQVQLAAKMQATLQATQTMAQTLSGNLHQQLEAVSGEGKP